MPLFILRGIIFRACFENISTIPLDITQQGLSGVLTFFTKGLPQVNSNYGFIQMSYN